LQRVLAAAGWGSRRACEQLILDGRVEVDGQVVDRLGTTVDPKTAKIFVDGERLKQAKLRYYLVNKPIGVVTTNRDPEGRPRVIDLVPDQERVFPVGRLDRSSEGLILVTNDGELAQRLAHPRFGVSKTYQVTVAGNVAPEVLDRLRRGVHLAEGLARVDHIKVKTQRKRATELEIVLREGKNREIRRILARVGHKVLHLKRVALGPLRLGTLMPGEVRVLSAVEIERWLKAIDAEARQQVRRRAPKPARGSAHARHSARIRGDQSARELPDDEGPRSTAASLGDLPPMKLGTIIGDESDEPSVLKEERRTASSDLSPPGRAPRPPRRTGQAAKPSGKLGRPPARHPKSKPRLARGAGPSAGRDMSQSPPRGRPAAKRPPAGGKRGRRSGPPGRGNPRRGGAR